MTTASADRIDHERLKALSKELRRPLETLYALASDNDPFVVDQPSRRAGAEWYADLSRRLSIRPGAHLRRIHYLLISQDPPPAMNGEPYQNTDYCWQILARYSRDARYLGLVPNLIDRRSDEPTIYLNDDEEEPASAGLSSGGLMTAGYEPIDAPRLALPSLWLRRPNIPQKYHLEIWCEKSTMNDILLPLGEGFGINILTGIGEFSFTRCAELVERARQSQRPVRILYMSDFDPAGASMPVAVARKIEFELYSRDLKDALDIQVRPIVLTHEQCQQYRLPRTPLKESERRAAAFEARFGEGATELDALEALHPGELRRILLREISRYYDDGLNDQIDAVVQEAEEDIARVTAGVMRHHAANIAALEAERVKLAAAIVSAEKKTAGILRKIARDLGEAAPDVDDYDWPEPADGDDDPDPLFDSTRDYVEQIDRYKQHQGKATTRKMSARVCEVCGVTFESRRRDARACSPQHSHQLSPRRERARK
jgi:hypothetical protein